MLALHSICILNIDLNIISLHMFLSEHRPKSSGDPFPHKPEPFNVKYGGARGKTLPVLHRNVKYGGARSKTLPVLHRLFIV